MGRQFKTHDVERERLRLHLTKHIESAKMAAHATGIPIQHITRYKKNLMDMGQLRVVGLFTCKITGRTVQYITSIQNILIRRNDQIEKKA